ncbi:hypothetical protein Tco_0379415 [Tanacetum coccineum]
MKKWKGRFFFIDRRAILDAMYWRHHDSDISNPAPKDGFDEADVITLTHQPIDIRGIPSGLLFSAGLAITWEFPKFRPLFKDPKGNGIHQRSRVTTPKECRDLMVNLIPPGVREEMNLLDNNIVLDRAWFFLARGAMAQAHALCQFESLYDTQHTVLGDNL